MSNKETRTESNAEVPTPCANEIYSKGQVVAIMSGGMHAMEGLVKEASRNGLVMDWHYVGGRAVVKTLGDVAAARSALIGAMPHFLDGHQ